MCALHISEDGVLTNNGKEVNPKQLHVRIEPKLCRDLTPKVAAKDGVLNLAPPSKALTKPIFNPADHGFTFGKRSADPPSSVGFMGIPEASETPDFMAGVNIKSTKGLRKLKFQWARSVLTRIMQVR